MEKMNSKPGLAEQGTGVTKPSAKLTLAALALAAMNTVACGGSEFSGTEVPVQDDAASDGTVLDVNPADAGKDAKVNDAGDTGTTDGEPAEAGADGETEAAVPDGQACDTLVFSKGTLTAMDIKPGQANQNVKMMGLNLTADCAPHILKQLSVIRQTLGSSDSFITALNLTDAQNNKIATDTAEDPATDKYTFENLTDTAPADTTRSLWVTADFGAGIVPGTAYKLVVKCPDDVVTDAPKLECQGADSLGQIYGPVINVVNP